jgi:hypothetical protein
MPEATVSANRNGHGGIYTSAGDAASISYTIPSGYAYATVSFEHPDTGTYVGHSGTVGLLYDNSMVVEASIGQTHTKTFAVEAGKEILIREESNSDTGPSPGRADAIIGFNLQITLFAAAGGE